ncbi:hypothetical protein ACFQS1_02445 [Paractinoplanes rhizophilus]|uniref:DUF4367 domain-containing protein n=1 Tax=Paractinoplanes rhizophilus TaxID=1416877 RepID=A0ABW2HIL0_9ACTN
MPDRPDDLIAELRALGDHLDVPEPADQRAAVRARLASARPPSRRHRWRLWLISALVAAVGATGAIAPARAAVLELLRVAGIEVRTTAKPTAVPAGPSPLPSQRVAALDEARRLAKFPVRLPAALGTPEQVTMADQDGTGAPRVVTVSYRAGKVRFDQFDGTLSIAFLKQSPNAQWVEIAAYTGIWVPGPHPVTYVDRAGIERTATARLAGPTLIWQGGTVTYRLEGLATKEEAVTAALSVK